MEARKTSRLPAWSRVWLTARHSPGKNQSIDAQLATLRDYCQANNLVVVREFIDRGVSGSDTAGRDAFSQMLDLVEGNKKKLVDGIICYDSSRLAREFDDATWARALLRRRGYILEILIGDDYPDGLYGYIMRGAEDYFNAEQIALISKKSRDGLRAFAHLKDDAGRYLGFWPMGVPWAFRQVFKRLPVVNTVTGQHRVKQCIEPDYDLWPLGRRLYTLRAEGLTYNQIEERTGWLQSRGTVDLSKNDNVARSYYTFFRNPIYFGQFRMKELVIDNYVPAMVERHLWDQANGTAAAYHRGNWRGTSTAETRSPKAGKTTDPAAILAGLCFCGRCDSLAYHTTTSTTRNRLRYYLCSRKRRLGTDSCESRLVRADDLEQGILGHVLDFYLDPDFVQDLVDAINEIITGAHVWRPDADRLQKELVEVSWSINNLIRLGERVRSDGEIDDLSKRLLFLQGQKADIEARLERIATLPEPAPIRASRSQILAELDAWKRRLDTETKQVLWQIIDRVVLDDGQATVYYRRPLCFYDDYPSVIVGFNNGYVIELPTQKHTAR